MTLNLISAAPIERDATGKDPDSSFIGGVDTVELSTGLGMLDQIFGGDDQCAWIGKDIKLC